MLIWILIDVWYLQIFLAGFLFFRVAGIWRGIILNIRTFFKAKAKAFKKVWMVKIMGCQIPTTQ